MSTSDQLSKKWFDKSINHTKSPMSVRNPDHSGISTINNSKLTQKP